MTLMNIRKRVIEDGLLGCRTNVLPINYKNEDVGEVH